MVLLPRAYEFGTHKDDGFSEKRIVSKQAGLLPTLTVDCEPNFRSGLRCGSFDQDMSQYDLDIQAGIKIMVVREDSWGLHDFARKGESLEKILAAVKYRATLVHDHPTNHLRIDMWSSCYCSNRDYIIIRGHSHPPVTSAQAGAIRHREPHHRLHPPDAL